MHRDDRRKRGAGVELVMIESEGEVGISGSEARLDFRRAASYCLPEALKLLSGVEAQMPTPPID